MKWRRAPEREGGLVWWAWVNEEDKIAITISIWEDGTFHGECWSLEKETEKPLETITTVSWSKLNKWLQRLTDGEVSLTLEHVDEYLETEEW